MLFYKLLGWAAGPGVTGLYALGISTSAPLCSISAMKICLIYILHTLYTLSKAQEKSRGTKESRGRSKGRVTIFSIDPEVARPSSDLHNTASYGHRSIDLQMIGAEPVNVCSCE